MYKKIFIIIGILILSAIGTLIFNLFLMPQMFTSSYFENFQFVKDFKQNKIFVNKTEQIYIREDSAIETAVEKVKNSIVVIRGAKTGVRAGLIVSVDGLLATVVSSVPAENLDLFINGEPAIFKSGKTDSKSGIVLFKAEKSNLQTVGFADSQKVKLGQKVFLMYAVSEKQNDWRVNEGVVRQISENNIKTTISEEKIATGSPLFNSVGEIVGLSFIDSDGRISAVPVDKIKTLLGL